MAKLKKRMIVVLVGRQKAGGMFGNSKSEVHLSLLKISDMAYHACLAFRVA